MQRCRMNGDPAHLSISLTSAPTCSTDDASASAEMLDATRHSILLSTDMDGALAAAQPLDASRSRSCCPQTSSMAVPLQSCWVQSGTRHCAHLCDSCSSCLVLTCVERLAAVRNSLPGAMPTSAAHIMFTWDTILAKSLPFHSSASVCRRQDRGHTSFRHAVQGAQCVWAAMGLTM